MANAVLICIYVTVYIYTCYCHTYEWHYLKGAFYGLTQEKERYNKAQLACQHEGAELATVVTLTEHSFLKYIMTYSQYWVGLKYNQTHYYWSGGESLNPVLWYPGDPNDYTACIRYYYDTTHQEYILVDGSCNRNFRFICQKQHNYYWSGGESLNPVLWYPGDPNDYTACIRYYYDTTQQEYILVDGSCNRNFRFICQKQHILQNFETGFGETMTKEELYNFATLWALVNRSRTQCAVECLNETQCLAFGHHSSFNECILYQWAENAVMWGVDESFVYFKLERLM